MSRKKKAQNLKKQPKKYHESCKTLPMRQLIDLFNTSDANSILINEGDEADPEELVKASEAIIQEWEKLKDSNVYKNYIRDKERYNYKKLELFALDTIMFALDYGFHHHAEKLIKEFKFNIKADIKESERKRKILNNWFRLHEEKNEGEQQEQIIWEVLKANLEVTIKFQVDYNCTVMSYLAFEEIAQKIERSKLKARNGEED